MYSVDHSAEPVILLSTKVQKPYISQDLIPRPRLVERLSRGLDRKLTLISAPAGFGKTTLLGQWLQGCERPVAWLSLDETDNDLVVFLRYLIAALQTLSADACDQTLGLLKAPQLPPLDYLATTLINEIAELSEPLVLALDDYHAIQDERIHHLVFTLIKNLPGQMHLALASRTDPPFPLVRLHVNRQMIEIRVADLRFTPDEARAFLEGAVGTRPSDETVKTLAERTEGWIAGLRLAAISMRRRDDHEAFVRSFKGSQQDLMNYLVTEVLSHQPRAIQDFLLRTSVLDRFCAPLCDHLLSEKPSESNSRAILDQLERSNLFLVPLDNEGRWYRYHHLFRELLRHRLHAQLKEDEVGSLHSRASAWHASNGYIEEAMRHALAAGDVLEAARLIEAHRHELLNREEWPTLERWLNGLPEEVVETRPALLLARGWILDLRVQFAGLERLLQQAETLLNSGSSTWPEGEVRSLGGEIDCLWSLLLLWGGEGQLAAERAQCAVERIPIEHAYAHSTALLVLGLALGTTGRSSIGIQTLNEFVAGSRPLPAAATVRVLEGLGYLHVLRGNYHQAAEWLRQLLQLSEAAKLTLSAAFAHWLLGRISYEWNETNTAIQHFLSAVDRRYAAHYAVFRDSVLVLALAYEGQGGSEEADDVLAELRRFAFETDSTHSLNEVDSFMARLMLLRGDLQSALNWSQTADPKAPLGWGIWVGSTALTKIRVLIAQETRASLREATGLLQELLADAESNHNIPRQIQLLAFLALAREGQGHTDQALAALERAVSLARPGGFVRTFADLGPQMAGLLSRLARRGVAPEYVARVLTAFDESSPPEAEPALDPVRQVRQLSRDKLIEPLTKRESEVLLLLAQGSSNKEIAETLVISRYTVKNHTGSIYQKLGVSGREQAVSKAKTLGLLVE